MNGRFCYFWRFFFQSLIRIVSQNNNINMHFTPLAGLRGGLRKFAACLAFLGFAQFVFAQPWIESLDKTHNFFAARDAFNKEWEGKKYERGKGYKQFKRWEHFMERRVSPTGEMPDPAAAWKARMEFLDSQNGAKRSLSLPPMSWTPLGPLDWENGSPTPPPTSAFLRPPTAAQTGRMSPPFPPTMSSFTPSTASPCSPTATISSTWAWTWAFTARTTGKMALWAGNGNGNNNVKYNGSANDRNTILSLVGLTTPNQIVTGYSRMDANMDGQIKYNGSNNDRNVILSNVGLTTPNNVLGEQLPQ